MSHLTWKGGAIAACLLLLALPVRSQQPRLSIQGSPYFDGDMALTVTDPTGAGKLVWLALGLDPLPLRDLAPTAIGPWAIGGELVDVLPVAFLSAAGRADVPFNLGPVIPSAVGAHLVVHGYVEPWLTNPATIPLDLPYFEAADAMTLTSPQPAPAPPSARSSPSAT